MTTRTPRPRDEIVSRLVVDTSPYLSCEECFERLDEYVEARARNARHTDLPMQAHLRGCSACREEAETLVELVALDR
jgi:hypothetical protein